MSEPKRIISLAKEKKQKQHDLNDSEHQSVSECFFWYRLTLVVLDKGPQTPQYGCDVVVEWTKMSFLRQYELCIFMVTVTLQDS